MTAYYGAGIGEGKDDLYPNPENYMGLFGCSETSIVGMREGWRSGSGAVRVLWNREFGRFKIDGKTKTTVDELSGPSDTLTTRTPTLSSITRPQNTLALADSLYYSVGYIVFRHNSKVQLSRSWPALYTEYNALYNVPGALTGWANISFSDGHVESMDRDRYDDARAGGQLVYSLR